MPIHVRAEPGDYAEAVLLPGDPLRAKYIAETYFDDPVQRNGERGLLGYTGTWKGKPVSVQGTGMGCPGATIVFEELDPARLQEADPRRHVRRAAGEPRARRPDRRAERRAGRLDRDAPRRQRAALPDRVLVARPRGRAPREAQRPATPRRPDRLERPLLQPERGPVRALGRRAACSRSRWRPRRCSPSPRSAASRRPACSPSATSSSRASSSGSATRSCSAAVDRMTQLALDVGDRGLAFSRERKGCRLPRQPGERERLDRASAGPKLRAARPRARARRATSCSRSGPGHLTELARERRRGRAADRRRRRRRDAERGRERRSPAPAPRSRCSRTAPARTSGARTGSRRGFDDAVRVALDGNAARDRPRPRRVPGRRRRGARSSRTSARSG